MLRPSEAEGAAQSHLFPTDSRRTWPEIQELADALKRLELNTMQQYRTRYLLARLTQYVDMAFSG